MLSRPHPASFARAMKTDPNQPHRSRHHRELLDPSGRTFRYTEAGPLGLAGKRVIIASSRGGLYASGMPFEAYDFQEKYLRAVFAFIGIEDVEFMRAEGLAFGPKQRDAAIRAALAAVPAAVRQLAA